MATLGRRREGNLHGTSADKDPTREQVAVRLPDGGAFTVTALGATAIAKQASNVRAAPSVTGARLAVLSQGQVVDVTGKVLGRDWYRVQLRNGDLGYVYSPLLEKTLQSSDRPKPGASKPTTATTTATKVDTSKETVEDTLKVTGTGASKPKPTDSSRANGKDKANNGTGSGGSSTRVELAKKPDPKEDVPKGTIESIPSPAGAVTSLAVSGNGRVLATGTLTQKIQIWLTGDLKRGQIIDAGNAAH